jgi:hypothetical protein
LLDLVNLVVGGEEEVHGIDEGVVVVEELLLVLGVLVVIIQNLGQSRLNREK